MESGTRKLLAFGILVGGVGLAWLVRPPAQGSHFAPPGRAPLILRKQAPRPRPSATQQPIGLLPCPAGPSASVSRVPSHPSSLASRKQAWDSVPGLPPRFPHSEYPALASSGHSLLRYHCIQDGDTLEKLAEQYLGSPALAIEIYQANRHVLADPYLLPIGAQIIIPPPDSVVVLSPDRLEAGNLVPVPDTSSQSLASASVGGRAP